jgi:hypothetical protein
MAQNGQAWRSSAIRRSWQPLVLCAAILALSGCSSTAPTPQATQVLTLSGSTALTPGLTTQLTATNSAGAVVSTGLTWQSSSTNVATVSPTIVATAGAATGRAAVVVQAPGNGTVTLTACTSIAIATPGRYALSGDLVAPGLGQQCLQFSNVASVQLDCAGHAVSGIVLFNANTVTISNCVVTVPPTFFAALQTNNVSNLTVTHCTVTGGTAAAILLQNGMNDQVLQSTMAGGYAGSKANFGTDDGIVLQNETGDTIQGNTISAFFDMGVEGVGVVSNATVANNTFSNLGAAAVGAVYCTSWTGNVIRGNQVSATPTLTLAGYNVGTQCGSVQAPAVFSGNQFAGNVFRNPTPGILGGLNGPTTVTGPSMSVQMSGTVMANVLQANDFGSNAGPHLTPLTGFIDGGGNICGPLDPTVSNFPCTGGGFQSTRLSMPLSEWLQGSPRARARAPSQQRANVGAR